MFSILDMPHMWENNYSGFAWSFSWRVQLACVSTLFQLQWLWEKLDKQTIFIKRRVSVLRTGVQTVQFLKTHQSCEFPPFNT